MIPGQTYTFQLKLTNWISAPSVDTVRVDLENNAPSFVSNVQVTSPMFTSLYNCQFTYNGDGSDVISDVAQSLLNATKQGSNDSFTFIGAVADTAQSITMSPGTAAQKVVDSVGAAVDKAVQGVAKSTADAAQKVLSPIEMLLILAVGLVVVVIFTTGKAGGVAATPEGGFRIGGGK
jgi:hypothetical protein